jgi:hypothetical protein
MGRLSAQAGLLVVLSLTVAVSAGCGTLNTQKNTYISVQCSGDRMLHLAIIPRVLPDGQPAAKERDALLKDVADVAGGYTLVERVMSAWKQPDSPEAAKQEADDLLIVAGVPELGMGLRQRLHDDFGQTSPFVLSLPIQSIRVAQVTPIPLEKQKPAPAMQEAAPAAPAPAPAH